MLMRGVGLILNWQKKYTDQAVDKIISYFEALAIPVYVAPDREHCGLLVAGNIGWVTRDQVPHKLAF